MQMNSHIPSFKEKKKKKNLGSKVSNCRRSFKRSDRFILYYKIIIMQTIIIKILPINI